MKPSKERKTEVYGLRCLDAYEWSSEHGEFLKGFVHRLVSGGKWRSTRCSILWRTLDVGSSRRVLHLASSAPDDEECGDGLLYTPESRNQEGYQVMNGKQYPRLGKQVTMLTTPNVQDARDVPATLRPSRIATGRKTDYLNRQIAMLPTPKAIDGIARHSQKWAEKKWNGGGDVDLSIAIKMLPTPATRDYKGANGPDHMSRETGHPNHMNQLPNAIAYGPGKGLKLQPEFVEWMMGFPEGWTELEKEIKPNKKGGRMDFGEALKLLKAGKKVRRAGWNGKGMWIVLMPELNLPPYNTQGTARKVNDRTAKWIGEDKPLESQPYIAMWTAQGKWQPGWLCAQPDMLSEDWEEAV